MRALALALLLLATPLAGQSSRDFDGTDDQILFGDMATLEGILNWTGFGMFWLDDDDATNAGVITKYAGGAGGNRSWEIHKTVAEQMMCQIRTDFPALGSAQSTATFSTGAWHCVVCTYDSADSTARVRLYLDGVADGTAHPGAGTITNAAGQVSVGVRISSEFWDGKLAYVGAEPRTWSPAEAAEYCRGNLALLRHGVPLWDTEATPTTYRGFGIFSGLGTATNHPAVSSDGPPAFFPGGGQ